MNLLSFPRCFLDILGQNELKDQFSGRKNVCPIFFGNVVVRNRAISDDSSSDFFFKSEIKNTGPCVQAYS
jgi:hypothetical protein